MVVAGEVIAEIGRGLLVLVGVARGDTEREAERLAERVLRYRVFADGDGRMNLSVREIKGSVLLVPQFTLAADTTGGLRPSFSTAAPPGSALHCSPIWSPKFVLAAYLRRADDSAQTCR